VRVNKPASALDKLRGGLQGPPLSSLVRLHELAEWLDRALPVGDAMLAEGLVRRTLLGHEACTVYWIEPGQPPRALAVAGPVPVAQGRRMLSRGLAGGTAPAPPPATAPGNPRALALQQAALQQLAVSRAAAAEVFGFPLQVEAAAAPATALPPPAPPAPPAEWTPERLRDRLAELKADRRKAPMQDLADEAGMPRRTIQHRLKQLADTEREARRTRQALAGVASHMVKDGKRRP